LTLGSNCLGNHVTEWHISDDPPLSYHRNTHFQTGTTDPNRMHCTSFEVTVYYMANFKQGTHNKT